LSLVFTKALGLNVANTMHEIEWHHDQNLICIIFERMTFLQ